MKNILLLSILFLFSGKSYSQYYYPPLTGSTWDTMDPSELGWCEDSIAMMEQWLEDSDTKAFIVLKDGKIVIEQYFGTFTQDSLYVWNSAGKTLTAYAVGIAQTEGDLDIDDFTSDYLGNGWTNATLSQEGAITVLNQLTMTSGLDDGVPDKDCTDPECLLYLTDPNLRWAYHNAPYTLLDSVIESATGMSLNTYVYQKIGVKIGMTGLYYPIGYNNVFISKARGMARFGLLLLSDGMWNGVTVQSDLNYLQAMRTPSQTLNPSYGYLTWLNGQSGYQLPGIQFLFNGPLLPNAPMDLYAAEGKNGQIINVVPSQGLVIVRMGATMGNSLVATQYNDTIWQYINRLGCPADINEQELTSVELSPNPGNGSFFISNLKPEDEVVIVNQLGQEISCIREGKDFQLDKTNPGIYFVIINRFDKKRTLKLVVK